MWSRNSGTTGVSEKHRFNEEALQHYLEEHVEGFSGRLVVREFKGGQSNPTYRLEAGSTSYVLRRKPPGKLLPSAHAVDREEYWKTLDGDVVDHLVVGALQEG